MIVTALPNYRVMYNYSFAKIMKLVIPLFWVIGIVACQQNHSQSQPIESPLANAPGESDFQPSDTVLPLTTFFSELFAHYYPSLEKKYVASFEQTCQTYELSSEDEDNKRKFYEIRFFHDLFTCNSASNGAMGGALRIPYLWHWVTPNPRHQITYLPTGELLTDIRPPKAFARYNSTADIDRTPALFLKDLATDEPQYQHPACGKFYTFGWCSEREMAFVQLMAVYGYTGKVVPEGNHSWSAFLVAMKDMNGNVKRMHVSVDNTFDMLDWEPITNVSKAEWLKDFEAGKLPAWYNRKAHSPTEAAQIQDIVISEKAMMRISRQIGKYFD